VDRPLKPQPRIVKGHPRPLGPQMGMVVGTIKNIVNTVGFADTPEESAHKAAVLDLKMTKMEIRHEKKKQNEFKLFPTLTSGISGRSPDICAHESCMVLRSQKKMDIRPMRYEVRRSTVEPIPWA